jgi:hypothetical protein
MDLPNGRERKALQHLAICDWESDAKLYSEQVGDGTIAKMIERRWIERLPDLPSGLKRVRITDGGQEALRAPALKPRNRPKLKVLQSRLNLLPPRIKGL